MKICIFEDDVVTNLAPLNYLRHTSELICGVHTILDKITSLAKKNSALTLHVRPYLSGYCKEKFPQYQINSFDNSNYLFLNSRIVFDKRAFRYLTSNFNEQLDTVYIKDNAVIAFSLSADKVSRLNVNGLEGLGLTNLDVTAEPEVAGIKIISMPSDLVLFSDEILARELKELIKSKKKSKRKKSSAELINKKEIYVSPKANILPNVVLDASHGPVYISDDVTIEPFSYIQGPVYIGEKSTIRANSRMYGPLRIGGQCKLAGEISHSTLHSFVNKQHHGFVGHSYICEWVNLGAGTTTSNLKNNYSKISVQNRKGIINTNSIFLGSIIGDHTKVGISSLLTTGSLIGVSSNVYGTGYQKKLIHSFSWVDNDSKQTVTYDIDKAVNTARTSMLRRNLEMSDAYEKAVRLVFADKDNLLV